MQTKPGQTLVEAIIAIAVIGVALLGFLSQSTYNFLASAKTIQRSLALNLAREGIEVVRHIRDSNWLKGCPDPDKENCFYWNTGLSDAEKYRAIPVFNVGEKKWELKFIVDSFDKCVNSKECALYKLNGFLTADPSGELTDFFRQVEIKPLCENQDDCGGDGICESGDACEGKQIGLDVVSLVRWKEQENWGNVVLEDKLFNWR
jgi:type II secretory pathway pseudopilin PulG